MGFFRPHGALFPIRRRIPYKPLNFLFLVHWKYTSVSMVNCIDLQRLNFSGLSIEYKYIAPLYSLIHLRSYLRRD